VAGPLPEWGRGDFSNQAKAAEILAWMKGLVEAEKQDGTDLPDLLLPDVAAEDPPLGDGETRLHRGLW
jgi:hypothetical protein